MRTIRSFTDDTMNCKTGPYPLHARRLRRDLALKDVVRILNRPMPPAPRPLRDAKPASTRGQRLCPRRLSASHGTGQHRETDDPMPAIVATMNGADPDIPLLAICTRLEAMRERAPRGRTNWQPSSVKMLLKQAERLRLLS